MIMSQSPNTLHTTFNTRILTLIATFIVLFTPMNSPARLAPKRRGVKEKEIELFNTVFG